MPRTIIVNIFNIYPKISFRYQITDSFNIRFSKGTAFSLPSMAQMFSSEINLGSVRDISSSVFVRQASIGNPNLKPATSNNSNLGLIFQKNSLRLSFDIWEIDYEDRIELINNSLKKVILISSDIFDVIYSLSSKSKKLIEN